jgi:hypothetical protein
MHQTLKTKKEMRQLCLQNVKLATPEPQNLESGDLKGRKKEEGCSWNYCP